MRTVRRIFILLAGFLVTFLVLLTAVAAAYGAATADPVVTAPPLGPHQHDIRTGDVVTRYRAWGSHGRPVLLIPGFVETSFVWTRVGPSLGQRFRVVAPDLRGFGYSTHRPPYTLAADTAQVAALIHRLHLHKPIVVGHSTGAAIAARLALTHPRLLGGIVMLDGDGTASGGGPAWVHALIVDPYFNAVFQLLTRHPSLLDGVWEKACGPRCPPFTGREMEGWIRPLEVPGAETALHAIVQAPLLGMPAARIRQIRVPTAVMVGTQDPTITLARARQLGLWLHARLLITVPGAHHLPMVSAPHLFTRDLSRIVDGLD
ncbi:MAG TPA: alpha/beta hydrolase [Chloroflexota bacterium]|nr:alpha/beta hydrolase [Chloroflexota bacterium]